MLGGPCLICLWFGDGTARKSVMWVIAIEKLTVLEIVVCGCLILEIVIADLQNTEEE